MLQPSNGLDSSGNKRSSRVNDVKYDFDKAESPQMTEPCQRFKFNQDRLALISGFNIIVHPSHVVPQFMDNVH